ncbi:hypothetical protein B5P43_36450 [Bacillus sp. SRB_336]|nr:hypothetical protein B5P43_36450 [Bacillus sp. SRB_336]
MDLAVFGSDHVAGRAVDLAVFGSDHDPGRAVDLAVLGSDHNPGLTKRTAPGNAWRGLAGIRDGK